MMRDCTVDKKYKQAFRSLQAELGIDLDAGSSDEEEDVPAQEGQEEQGNERAQ